MALTPYTERQKTLIVNNIVRACKDITKLNAIGYKYINLCSGFIAHYNRYGFIDHYSRYHSLRSDILLNADMNQWRNFRPSDREYEYYMAKAEIYNRILEAI